MGAGGARPGAGRPKKADEEKIIRLSQNAMNKIFGSEEAFFEHLWTEAKADFSHLKLAMEYQYGKPKERKEITTPEGISFSPITFLDES